MNNIQNYGNINAYSNYDKVNKSPNFKGKQIPELSEIYFCRKYFHEISNKKPKTFKNVLIEGTFNDFMNFIYKKLGFKKP